MLSKIKKHINFNRISNGEIKAIQDGILNEIGLELKFTLRKRQVEAIYNFVVKGKDILCVLPTGYGKTIIAVICALYVYVKTGKSTVYIGILKALTKELNETIHDYFMKLPLQEFEKEKFNNLIEQGLEKEEALGFIRSSLILDGDHRENKLDDSEEWVLCSITPEKLDSILNSPKNREIFMEKVGFVIGDEIHCLGDLGRGDNYEHLLITIYEAYPDVRFAYLSATIKNTGEFGEWLKSKVVFAPPEERPVSLNLNFKRYMKQWYNYEKRKANFWANQKTKKSLLQQILRNGKGTFIIFTTSRPRTQELAQFLTGVNKELSLKDMVNGYGIGYHHAGLTRKQKHFVEDAFRNGILRYVVATPTLAVGVNLPADNTILFDVAQWTQNHGENIINANRIQQTQGRAGRPTNTCRKCESSMNNTNICPECGWINEGTAYLITCNEYYPTVKDRAENPLVVESKLKERLHEKILQWMGSGLAYNIDLIYSLCLRSFADICVYECNEAMNWLESFGFVKKVDEEYRITWLGIKTIRCYIQPETVVYWKRNIQGFTDYNNIRELYVRFASVEEYYSVVTVRSEDADLIEYGREELGYYYPKTYKDRYNPCISCSKKFTCDSIMTHNNEDANCEYHESDIPIETSYEVLKSGCLTFYDDFVVPHLPYKKKKVNGRWTTTNELKHLSFSPGDKRALQEASGRMFGAASFIFNENDELSKNLNMLSEMGKIGTINLNLISLMSLDKIGITRAKALYDGGIKSKEEFMKADPIKIGKIIKLGANVVKGIKKLNQNKGEN
jgi:replicative superfamily II helicase